jgi:hypothetical protein
MARTTPCQDEDSCKGTTIEFTKVAAPYSYGKINRNRDPNEHHRATNDYFEMCARMALQTLYIQTAILAFLVDCVHGILHDKSVDDVVNHTIEEEPAVSAMLDDDGAGHATFSNVLMIEPYHGWHSLNFEKLRGYIAASFGLQQEHVWALREDPSYFADTQ